MAEIAKIDLQSYTSKIYKSNKMRFRDIMLWVKKIHSCVSPKTFIFSTINLNNELKLKIRKLNRIYFYEIHSIKKCHTKQITRKNGNNHLSYLPDLVLSEFRLYVYIDLYRKHLNYHSDAIYLIM